MVVAVKLFEKDIQTDPMRFEGECLLVGRPNIVQFIGTNRNPETRLPVLFVELCKGLCSFLECSSRPPLYHVLLSIVRDTVLALEYLHLSSIIHRDLTDKNVLMMGGVSAKVTDFSMSKPPYYKDNLDIYSFGVLLIEVMTRQFPHPTQVISVHDWCTVRAAVLQGQAGRVLIWRHPNQGHDQAVRKPYSGHQCTLCHIVTVFKNQQLISHFQLIVDTHLLKAITSLKDKEKKQLNSALFELMLKQVPESTDSLQQARTGVGTEEKLYSMWTCGYEDIWQQKCVRQMEKEPVVDQKQRENEQILDEMAALVQPLVQLLRSVFTDTKIREVLQVQSTVQEKERELQKKERELQEKERGLEEKERELQEKERGLHEKERELEAKDHGMQTSQRLVAQLNEKLCRRNKQVQMLSQKVWDHQNVAKENSKKIKAQLCRIQQLQELVLGLKMTVQDWECFGSKHALKKL